MAYTVSSLTPSFFLTQKVNQPEFKKKMDHGLKYYWTGKAGQRTKQLVSIITFQLEIHKFFVFFFFFFFFFFLQFSLPCVCRTSFFHARVYYSIGTRSNSINPLMCQEKIHAPFQMHKECKFCSWLRLNEERFDPKTSLQRSSIVYTAETGSRN